jgi:hypothetical protein
MVSMTDRLCRNISTLKKTEPSPAIQFIGALDTVKATDYQSLHDLSFTPNARVARHALALNENRVMFQPTLFNSSPEGTSQADNRSALQSWFVGSHSDIGVGYIEDGLSLYPLQWMLIESKAYGLKLEHNPKGKAKGMIEDPLALVFPHEKVTSEEDLVQIHVCQPWEFVLGNGIKVTMHDLRSSHNHGNLQQLKWNRLKKPKPASPVTKKRWTEPVFWTLTRKSNFANDESPPSMITTSTNDPSTMLTASRQHVILVHQSAVSLKIKRPVFEKGRCGSVTGYSDQSTNSTIIHPSVYFLQEIYGRHGIGPALKCFASDLAEFRDTVVPNNKLDPWFIERQFTEGDLEELKDFRIFVCGRAGIGKSALINKVFGEVLVRC